MPLKCISSEVKKHILKTSKAPYHLYHGTDAAADICLTGFNVERAGKHDPGDFGKGIYLHTSKSFSKMYGKNVLEVVVDLKKPLFFDFETKREEAYKKLDELVEKYGNPVRGCEYTEIEQLKNEAQRRGVEPHQLCRVERTESAERWRNELLKQGYDGIVAHGYEGKGSTTVVAFKEGSIALTDCTPRESKECKICDWEKN